MGRLPSADPAGGRAVPLPEVEVEKFAREEDDMKDRY